VTVNSVSSGHAISEANAYHTNTVMKRQQKTIYFIFTCSSVVCTLEM